MKDVLVEALKIPSNQQQKYISDAFDKISSGDSITIVNDKDLKSLISILRELHPKEFSSDIIENGPDLWKVKLTKKKSEGCCGCC